MRRVQSHDRRDSGLAPILAAILLAACAAEPRPVAARPASPGSGTPAEALGIAFLKPILGKEAPGSTLGTAVIEQSGSAWVVNLHAAVGPGTYRIYFFDRAVSCTEVGAMLGPTTPKSPAYLTTVTARDDGVVELEHRIPGATASPTGRPIVLYRVEDKNLVCGAVEPMDRPLARLPVERPRYERRAIRPTSQPTPKQTPRAR